MARRQLHRDASGAHWASADSLASTTLSAALTISTYSTTAFVSTQDAWNKNVVLGATIQTYAELVQLGYVSTTPMMVELPASVPTLFSDPVTVSYTAIDYRLQMSADLMGSRAISARPGARAVSPTPRAAGCASTFTDSLISATHLRSHSRSSCAWSCTIRWRLSSDLPLG